ncbi:MAG: hypothetical protein BGP24_03625 [Lysobacterales bacterium 69-70]|nr:hypothetical protein [Xanthomonadaceae bacterium]ODU32104.1 MAG: hypothetical protein ABS97_17890 [Xanthomonadaceae bacterium SCN 69-320]ODV18964.1 MAG: hypothetical protein ABT27_12035 [Xanthomonadaceae bacterium SCN 69-25]OJZ01826.1 MAG: hypothetical protein BGP24_03625 [Xanthomonadales bacterium 69-70]
MNTTITRNAAFATSGKSDKFARHTFALLMLAASVAAAPAFAGNATKSKTTGSHISRGTEAATGEDTRLEPVDVMIGAVRDARSAAREARDEPSRLPDLPQLDAAAFLDAPSQPPR